MKAAARSIHREVLAWVLGALGLGAGLLVAATWWVLSREMEEVFEDNLRQVALAVVHHHGIAPGMAPRLAQELPRVYEEFGSFEFVTAVWSREGVLLASSDRRVNLPFRSRSGLSLVQAGGEAAPEDAAALAELAGGSVGEAFRMTNLDGLRLYGALVALLSALPRLDRPRLIGLAETGAGKGAAERFDLILTLLDLFLARLARAGALRQLPVEA